jgi:uncharacterized phage-associated protein
MNLRDKKIKNTILFFANKSANNKIGRLKLIKLIWLSDRLHLNKYGRLILKDDYKALPNGPIASKALNMAQCSFDEESYTVNKHIIQAQKELSIEYFSKSDLEVMEYVWAKFGKLNGFELRNLSHEFLEWKRYENDLENKLKPNAYKIVITDLFTNSNGFDFSDLFSKEKQKYSKEIFLQHKKTQEFLSQ